MATKKPYTAQPIDTVDFDEVMRRLDEMPSVAPAVKPERSTVRAVGDLATQFAGGAVSGVRMMSDVFGADNAVSGGLRSAEQALSALQSAAAKADQQEIARIMQEAEGKGWGEQIASGLKAFGVAPGAVMAQALGTSLPTLATAAIPGVGPAAAATRLGMAGAIGGAQGAGNIKGVIYEEVKNKLATDPTLTPEQIEARAVEAQAYSGENAGQIALGGGLGVLAGSTGMERAVAGLRNGVTQAAPGMLARVGMGAAAEAVPEAMQGGQEKFAGNTALANEGFDVDPWSGVVAQGTMEAAAGGLMGGAFGVPNPRMAVNPGIEQPQQTPGDAIRSTELVPEGGPMTRAANVATEAKAQSADAMGASLTGTDPAAMMGRSADPLAGRIAADRQQTEDAAVARNQFADRNAGSLMGGGLGGSRADPLANMLGDARTSDANSFTNIQQVANNRPPMPASDAARILEEAKARDLDFTAAPHPDGGFVVVPRAWVTPAAAAKAETEIAQTLERMRQADAAPVQRAPRTGTTAQELDLTTDPVTNYVNDLRQVNTPAAKLFVRDFDAGSLTADDVRQRMEAERTKTPDERLAAAAAAEGLRMNPQGNPFITLMAARRAAKQNPGEVIQLEGGGYAIRQPQEIASDPIETTAGPTDAGSSSEVPPTGAAAQGALNVQDAPQPAAGTQAQAAPGEAPAPAGRDAAATGGVPDAGAGAGVRADGVGGKQEFNIGGRDPHTVTFEHKDDGRLIRTVTYPDGQTNTETLVTDRNGDESWASQSAYEKGEFYPAQLSGEEASTAIRDDISGKAVETAAPGAGDVQADGVSPKMGDTSKVVSPEVSPKMGDRAKSQADGVTAGVPEVDFGSMTPDQRKRARLEQEIATGKTNNGGVIASLRPSAIEKRKQELAQMGDAGRLSNPSKNPPKIDTSAKPAQETAKNEQVKKPTEPAKTAPFDHAGLKIRQTRTKVGNEVVDGWLVQSPENAEREARGERQIGGDRIVETREQAVKTAEQEVQRAKDERARKDALDREDADRKAVTEARKEANRGKTLLERRAEAILDKQIRESSTGDVITRREWVERRVKEGLEPKVTQEDKIKPMSRMQAFRADNRQQAEHDKKVKEAGKKDVYWLGDFEITKTEYDYVQKVKANPPAESKPKPEATPETAPTTAEAENTSGWSEVENGFTSRPVYRYVPDPRIHWATVQNPSNGVYVVEYRIGDKVVSTEELADRLLAVKFHVVAKVKELDAGQASHQDPGEKPEAATKGVVNESLKTAAKNEGTKPSEMRKWLLAEIDKDLLNAPDRADFDDAVKRVGEKDAISMYTGSGLLGKNAETGFITFDVPGDGKFKVRNSVRGLLEFRKNISASQGFKDAGQRTVGPEQNDGAQSGSGGKMAAINNMIDEGDFEAARDYAEAVEINLDDVKVPRGERKVQWDAFRKDGTLPPPVDTRPLPPQRTQAQIEEEKRQAQEAEEKRPKDTGWNMAGTGYAGKRYRGRNITTDDGRQIVARVYENAGSYDEVEVKVDGVRKFTVNDRNDARGKADAFIRTLTADQPKADGVGRAVAGGQEGVNGYFYKGGQFLPSTMAEPGKWKVDGKWVTSGRALIGPREYGYQPTPFSRSLFEIAGVGQFTQVTWDGRLAIQEGVRTNQGEPVTGDMTIRPGVKGVLGKEELTIQEIVNAWNSGQRWFDVKPEAETVTTQADSPTIPEGYKPAGEPFYRDGKLTQGYAPFDIGQRVTMKESGGQSGVIDLFTSPDKNGVFDGAMVKFDNGLEQIVKLNKLEAEAAPVAAAGTRREPTKVSMFNPYEDGDIVTIGGQDWTVRQDTPGWYLTNTGNWRGTHPTIRNVKAMADLIRAVEQADVAQSKPAEPEAETPRLTPAEAAELMEWQDLGQKDGVKTHILTFYESKAKKDAKRGRMTIATITKGDRSATAWMVDGDDKTFGPLSLAKRRAMEVGMAKAVSDGFVDATKPAAPAQQEAQKAGDDRAKPEPVAPIAAKVDDFGEKLPPARRAMAAKLSEELTDEAIATQPLSKIWPLEENAAIEDKSAAAVAHVFRDAIPAKPRTSYKVKTWVSRVKMLRDFAASVLSGRLTRDKLISELEKVYSLRGIGAKIRLLEGVDREQWKRIGDVSEAPDAIRYVDGKAVPEPSASVSIDGKTHWLKGSGNLADHMDAINAMLTGDAPESRMQFEVRQEQRGARKVFINKKGDKEYRRLMEFDTAEEARKAIEDQYADLVAAWEGVKSRDNITERDLRTAENRPRTGKDHRKGRDISSEEFQSQFGFRGGEFGKWVSQGKGAQERQFMLNSAYDALMDLSDIIGVPPKAISLDGTLGVAFGSRGGGWASAHFEPSNLVINLTKPRGAGALAHEWFHALDNYFARKRGGEVPIGRSLDAQNEYRRNNFITHKTRPMMVRKDGSGSPVTRERMAEWRKSNPLSGYLAEDKWMEDPNHKLGVRAEVEERFNDLVQVLDASPMLKRSRRLEGSKTGDGYWSRTLERAARSFENYIQVRMNEQGYHNDFLVNVKTAPDVQKNIDRYPYLLPSEVQPIADAFNGLFGTIQTKVDDAGNVAMFNSIRTANSTQPKLSQDAVEQAVSAALNRVVGAPRVQVAVSPAAAGVTPPAGVVPKGVTLPDGSVFVFADGAESVVDVQKTVFHELFHRGSKVRFTSNSDYITKMLDVAANDAVVQAEVTAWKNTEDGRAKRLEFESRGPMTGARLANFEALAVEEALASMGEKVVNGELRNPETTVKQILRFLSKVANAWGMNRLAPWLNSRSMAEAERFILETVSMSGGKVNQFTNAVLFRSADAPNDPRAMVAQIRQFDVAGKTGNTLAHYRSMALQALGRRQLVDLYQDYLPQLKEYDRLVQNMEAEKNDTGAEADGLARAWGSLDGDTKRKGEELKLAELMHDATLAKIDPQKDYQAGDDRGQWAALRAKFNALDPKAQALYVKARDMYADHYAKVRKAIAERIERSEMSDGQKKKTMARMDDDFFKKTKGVYFPLSRFGSYVMVVKDANGDVVNVSRAETLNEAETTRKELMRVFPRDGGFNVSKVLKDAEFNAGRDAVGKGFMADLLNELDKQGVDDALRDSVSQLYLASLPDLSWAKHGIHRKGTPGFSQDARRAFAQNMFHGARHLAKLRYSDRLQGQLEAMDEHIKAYREIDEYDSVKAQQVLDEMVKRHESLMNPKTNPLSTALTSVGFVFYLGISPAAAMVNLSQTALVAYPIMGAKWGFGKASAALLRASKETVAAKNDISKVLQGDELAAYEKAVKDGTIDVTMAHDLAGISQGEDAKVTWALRPVMRAASFLFHHAERFNRQATFIASFRLAKEAGADNARAFEEAKKATYDGHFDYGAANRPRVMQGNVAKVVLLFKQYGQNMVYTLSRQAYLSMKGLTPADRAEARKQLGGILALHAAAAGALGLPLVGPLLAAASFLGGDDDEPWNAEVALKNALADELGPKAAEVLSHGLSRLTPWDISSRVALDRLILPDVREGLEGQDYAEAMMVQAVGPVGGIFVGMAKGLQSMSDGKYGRGFEEMLPVALRNPIKAIRFAEEGAVDKSGVVIKDEVSLSGVLGQASGFAPSEVRLATEGKSAIISYDRALMDRRQTLMAQFAQARMAGDAEGMADARKDIERFNSKNPARRITPANLIQSVRARQRRIDGAEQGVYLPKNRRDAMEAGRFAAEAAL